MFRKASRCKADSPQCVEVSLPETDGQSVYVRDSKYPGVMLMFTVDEWRMFVAAVRAGEFDA